MRKQIINTLKVSNLSTVEKVLYTRVRTSNNIEYLHIFIANLYSNDRSIRQIEYLMIHNLKLKNVNKTVKDALMKYQVW